MKKSELQEIAEMLLDAYGSGRHYEIIRADKIKKDGWYLEIHEIVEPRQKKTKGAENESNK